MKKLLLLPIAVCAAVSVNADIIGLIDSGGLANGSGSTFENHSTGGDSIGAMTGSFTANRADYARSSGNDGLRWNHSEFAFKKAAAGSKTAVWTFGGLDVNSEWEVFASWDSGTGSLNHLSAAAPYTINGSTVLVSQRTHTAGDLQLIDSISKTINFQSIGTASIAADGKLIVTLSNATDNWVQADAIAIVQTSIPEPAVLNLVALFGGAALFIRRRFFRNVI